VILYIPLFVCIILAELSSLQANINPLAGSGQISAYQESHITSCDGTELYSVFMPAHAPARINTPAPEQIPTIIWVHGYGKHCQRYLHAMTYFAQHGFSSIGFDIRGHGRSGGQRAHLEKFSDCLDDFDAVYQFYKDKINGKLFIIAHSMGSLLAIRHLEQDSQLPIDATILTAPCLDIHAQHLPRYKRFAIKIVSKIFPRWKVPIDSQEKKFRYTHHTTQDILPDPYNLTSGTLKSISQALTTFDTALHEAHKISKPIHIIMGGQDAIVDNIKTQKFYSYLPDDLEKSIITYDDMYHSILHEVDREQIFERITGIFNKHIFGTYQVNHNNFKNNFIHSSYTIFEKNYSYQLCQFGSHRPSCILHNDQSLDYAPVFVI